MITGSLSREERPTSILRARLARIVCSTGVVVASPIIGACPIDDIPCPGQCFEYTVEYDTPKECIDGEGEYLLISFNATTPDGYHGRFCFNAASVLDVVAAIDHLEAGGQLAELSMEVRSAYLTTVEAVRANAEAECITAAPGQCTNAAQVCNGVGADLYEQLVVEETCVLALGGVEPVELGPGQVCEPIAGDPGTGSAESGAHCPETTIGAGDDVDDTSVGSDGADETSGATTGMVFGTHRRAR